MKVRLCWICGLEDGFSLLVPIIAVLIIIIVLYSRDMSGGTRNNERRNYTYR